jgi:hypothetical protein
VLAPNLGVTMSSPDPTIDAVMISPGPSCRRMPPTLTGAAREGVDAADVESEEAGWDAGLVDTSGTLTK